MHTNDWNILRKWKKFIFRFSPHVSDTSQWAEGNSWYSPHLALTPAAGCTLKQTKPGFIYSFPLSELGSEDICGYGSFMNYPCALYWILTWSITVFCHAVDCVIYVCFKSTSYKDKSRVWVSISFNLGKTSYSYLYPWPGWTVQQCRRLRWVWLRSLHHREVGCGTGSPLRPALYLLLFLWLLKRRWLCPGWWLCPGRSALHWVGCRPWWVWWWSAAALGGRCAGFPLPEYPAMRRQHQCHMLYKLFRGTLWV